MVIFHFAGEHGERLRYVGMSERGWKSYKKSLFLGIFICFSIFFYTQKSGWKVSHQISPDG